MLETTPLHWIKRVKPHCDCFKKDNHLYVMSLMQFLPLKIKKQNNYICAIWMTSEETQVVLTATCLYQSQQSPEEPLAERRERKGGRKVDLGSLVFVGRPARVKSRKAAAL